MMQKRMETLMQKLPAGTDAALIQSDVNRRYLTGMQSSAGTVLCFRDGAYLIIDFRYIEKARECVKNCTVLEQHDLYEQIRELLRKHNARTLSVESMTMTLSQFSKLKQQLGNQVQLDQSDALSRAIFACRTVKTEAEIDKIRKAQRIAEIAFADICNFLRAGISERDVMLRLNQTMMEHGSEGESFPTIATGGKCYLYAPRRTLCTANYSGRRLCADGLRCNGRRLSQRHDPYRLRGTAQRKDAAGL